MRNPGGAGSGPMKICLVNGSARTDGQTAGLLNKMRRTFEAHGANTFVIHLRNAKLEPCDGSQTPHLRADFRRLFTRLTEAHGIVFATPTYWFNVSGLMKNFLERLTVAEKNWPLEGSVAGFIATGESHEDGAMVALMTMAAMANHLGMVTFPYSMVYFRRGRPHWAGRAIANYAENMIHMMRVMQRDGKSWK
jgi:multimeric flavodoxin WrbA